MMSSSYTAHMHTYMHMHTHTHTCAHTQKYTCTCTYTHIKKYTHIHTSVVWRWIYRMYTLLRAYVWIDDAISWEKCLIPVSSSYSEYLCGTNWSGLQEMVREVIWGRWPDDMPTSSRNIVAGRLVIWGGLSLTSVRYTYTAVLAVKTLLDAITVSWSEARAGSGPGVSTY